MGAIGCGGQGTRHIGGGIWVDGGGFLSKPNVQFVAVCDVNARNRQQARGLVNKYYGNKDCAEYGDFRELLAREDIDAVLIATGDRWHPLVSIAAAKAGKDAYCEKPSSVTIAEAGAMRETMRKYKSIYQVGTQQRSSWAFRHACELVRNGYIGEVKEVIVGVGGTWTYSEHNLPEQRVPPWLDYNMWLGPVRWQPFNEGFVGGWMAYRDCSGGEMTNWGAHHFDIAQWGLGTDGTGPVEIFAPDGREHRVLTYRYANGVVVTRDPERLQREAGVDNGVLFVGTEGKVAVWRYAVKTWPDALVKVRLGVNDLHLYESKNHQDNFLECVRSRHQPVTNMDIGCGSITVCHLGTIAYELGRRLQWDPESERFVWDDEANRLLSRPMRSPWHL
jgi:predicted dehydrogenase